MPARLEIREFSVKLVSVNKVHIEHSPYLDQAQISSAIPKALTAAFHLMVATLSGPSPHCVPAPLNCGKRGSV